MQLINYSEAVRELESLGVMPDRAPSLTPMKEALARLAGSLQINSAKTIIVAGTNGKGSVCSTLEALLLAEGKTVGLYTSPHLEETTERIRINGKEISKDFFVKVFCEIKERLQNLQLTHFEFLTLMAVWAFYSGADAGSVEWTILEVGLGGIWDATNAVPHDYCVITSLGYDHQNLLGNDIRQIAANKFGIVGEGATVVYAPLPEGVQETADAVKFSTKSRWVPCVPFSSDVILGGHNEPTFFLKTKWGQTPIFLAGKRGAQNTALALTAFQELGFTPEKRLACLKEVRWPGRMEKISNPSFPCPVYLSGDHNPQGMASLIELLPYYPRKHLFVLVGVGKDKHQDGILAPLFELENTSVYLTETPFRGRNLASYGDWLAKAAGSSPDPLKAFAQILTRATSSDLILVTGSLYLVGMMRGFVQQFLANDLSSISKS